MTSKCAFASTVENVAPVAHTLTVSVADRHPDASLVLSNDLSDMVWN